METECLYFRNESERKRVVVYYRHKDGPTEAVEAALDKLIQTGTASEGRHGWILHYTVEFMRMGTGHPPLYRPPGLDHTASLLPRLSADHEKEIYIIYVQYQTKIWTQLLIQKNLL